MKERKFKEKLKSIASKLVLYLGMISFVLSIAFIMDGIPNASTGIKVATYTTFGVCVAILVIMLSRVDDKSVTLELAKQEYGNYIKLVDEQLYKIEHVEPEDVLSFALMFQRSLGSDYLVYFLDKLNKVCETKIAGKPDSFILASCLVYGLIMSPKITASKGNKNEETEVAAAILNAKLALNCALKIISEPSTYYKDDTGNWLEEKHPKVEISVPGGLIKDDVLYDRIIKAILQYDFSSFSIMQFSNLLHLIYLNCQNNQ